MKCFREIKIFPPVKQKPQVFLWGKIHFNKQKNIWAVKGTFQGKRYYFSQMPTSQGLVPCDSERMAKRLREMLSVEIQNGDFVPEKYKASQPLILKNYAQTWLQLKKPEVSTATFYDYANSLNRHILPVLGDYFLPDLNFDALQALLNTIDRRPKGKKNVMDCLKQVLKSAKRSKYLSQVPEFPEFKGKNKITPPIIKYLSQKAQLLIIGKIPVKHRPIFLFMMASGCRPSEARALRKTDISNAWIMFRNAFGRGEELKTVKQTKAEGFPITKEIQQILDENKNLTPWLFPNPTTGKPYSKNINRIWNKACIDSGVQKINLYNATRHSFACQLLNKGVDKGMVSRLLRHSDPRMVERYTIYEINPLKKAVENVRKIDFKKKRLDKGK